MVRGIIERLLPETYQNIFIEETIEPEKDGNIFVLGARDGKILLAGDNEVSKSMALGHYLKYCCRVHLSWCGDQLDFPKTPPMPKETIKRHVPQKYRVYMNYCTLAYSAAWWDWERWQREIDFMALNGINMPLTVIGTEAVWFETLRTFGFSEEEALSFISGPAYWPWQLMNNIEGVYPVMRRSYVEERLQLGRKILARQLEFGMMPIQQGYVGFVPSLMKEKFADASIRTIGKWCNFPQTASLDPLDPLFFEIGREYLKQQDRLLGSYHYYAADPFHENSPPSKRRSYLAKVGRRISALLEEFDPQATWVMQSWSMRKQIVKAVDPSKLLILDLNGKGAQKNRGCWGYPYVAGILHNFGERLNMHGDLELVSANPFLQARARGYNVQGTGLFMEGINQNPLYYDLVFETGVADTEVDLGRWVQEYALRRYGAESEYAQDALASLRNNIYAKGSNDYDFGSIIVARPSLNVRFCGAACGRIEIPYALDSLKESFLLLYRDREMLKASDAYCFDVMDLLRQILSGTAQGLYRDVQKTYVARDRSGFQAASRRFLKIMDGMDRLLAARPEYDLYRWIGDAAALAGDEHERKNFVRNARALVTVWGPEEEPHIFDYAWKEWAGLIDGFYKVRWQKFFKMLDRSLEEGRPYDYDPKKKLIYGRELFFANDFYRDLARWELEWVRDETVPVRESRPDLFQTADLLIAEWLQ